MGPLRHPAERDRAGAVSDRGRDQASASGRRLRRFVQAQPHAPRRKNGGAAEPRHLPHGRWLRVAHRRDHRRRRRRLSRHRLGRLLHRARQSLGRRLGAHARHDQSPERKRQGRTQRVNPDVLGAEKPIVLAPMGFVSGGALAAAVSQAGGFGLIGAGYGDGDWIRREFQQAAGAAVGVGFITWSLAKQPQLLDLALGYQPRAVMLSFGDPRPYADRIRASGAALICQVQRLEQVAPALEGGAEVIVAQGGEAGGHGANVLHSRAVMSFVPEIADLLAQRSPGTLLLAAGGIADGRGIAASLLLGADGVLVGSRLWATKESLASAAAKEHAVACDGDSTARSAV